MANWFPGKPEVEKIKQVPYKESWPCPQENCEGEMMNTGLVWSMEDPGYHHRCTKCGVVWVIQKATYPRIVFEKE